MIGHYFFFVIGFALILEIRRWGKVKQYCFRRNLQGFDEIENGLDPRTIGLLLNEIRNETTTGGMQVVITTHSPYLLDQLPIESIITTEKPVNFCKYHIPATEERLKVWIEKFTPGRLYITGKFSN